MSPVLAVKSTNAACVNKGKYFNVNHLEIMMRSLSTIKDWWNMTSSIGNTDKQLFCFNVNLFTAAVSETRLQEKWMLQLPRE